MFTHAGLELTQWWKPGLKFVGSSSELATIAVISGIAFGATANVDPHFLQASISVA